MSIRIRHYQKSDDQAILRLNQRLEKGGASDRVFAENRESDKVKPGVPILKTKLWVAEDGTELRGGVWLKEHAFWASNKTLQAGWVKYPVAESLVNPKYGGVPGALIFNLVRHQPHLMAIGMGGHHQPIARILSTIGWSGYTIPRYIYINNPIRVLRECTFLRNTSVQKTIADILALSGLGWLGGKLCSSLRRRLKMLSLSRYQYDIVHRFAGWADSVWEQNKHNYKLAAVRNAETLNTFYPDALPSVTKLRVYDERGDIGWACVARLVEKAGTESKFGNSNVGIIFDVFSHPNDALRVIAAATDQIIGSGMDIVLASASHRVWGNAFRSLGYLRLPGSYAFYISPELIKSLELDQDTFEECLFTAADSHAPEMLRYHLRAIHEIH